MNEVMGSMGLFIFDKQFYMMLQLCNSEAQSDT